MPISAGISRRTAGPGVDLPGQPEGRFFLFLFVGAAVYHRYVYHELPPARFAPTFFIGIAPTAVAAVALFKLIHLLRDGPVFGLEAAALEPEPL